jgi:hypothetical protein
MRNWSLLIVQKTSVLGIYYQNFEAAVVAKVEVDSEYMA